MLVDCAMLAHFASFHALRASYDLRLILRPSQTQELLAALLHIIVVWLSLVNLRGALLRSHLLFIAIEPGTRVGGFDHLADDGLVFSSQSYYRMFVGVLGHVELNFMIKFGFFPLLILL